MCNWTAWWFSPDGDLDRKQVAEQIAALALASVRRSDGARDARDLRSLVGAIRENLDVIERIGDVQPKRRPPRKAPAARAKSKAGLRA